MAQRLDARAVGILASDPMRSGRWTLFDLVGAEYARFAQDQTREQIAETLAKHGMLLRNDDIVERMSRSVPKVSRNLAAGWRRR
jgi:hypothetical protein